MTAIRFLSVHIQWWHMEGFSNVILFIIATTFGVGVKERHESAWKFNQSFSQQNKIKKQIWKNSDC